MFGLGTEGEGEEEGRELETSGTPEGRLLATGSHSIPCAQQRVSAPWSLSTQFPRALSRAQVDLVAWNTDGRRRG